MTPWEGGTDSDMRMISPSSPLLLIIICTTASAAPRPEEGFLFSQTSLLTAKFLFKLNVRERMKTEEHVEQGWRTTQPKTIYSFLNQCTVLNHDWNIRWSTFLKLLCLFHPHHAKPTIWLQYKRTQNLPQNANVTKTKFCKTKKT